MKTYIEVYMKENGIEPTNESDVESMGDPDEVIIIEREEENESKQDKRNA